MSSPDVLQVSFLCVDNEPIAKFAEELLVEFDFSGYEKNKNALYYLQDLAERDGFNHGSKGGVSTWATVGNYISVASFIDSLHDLWLRVLAPINSITPTAKRILIYHEQNQRETSDVYELYMLGQIPAKQVLSVRVHENLPFCLGLL